MDSKTATAMHRTDSHREWEEINNQIKQAQEASKLSIPAVLYINALRQKQFDFNPASNRLIPDEHSTQNETDSDKRLASPKTQADMQVTLAKNFMQIQENRSSLEMDF